MVHQWEYQIVEVLVVGDNREKSAQRQRKAEALFNELGKDGWEAVNAWGADCDTLVLFKRLISK